MTNTPQQPNKPGAPYRNKNRMTHGMRSDQLGAGQRYIEQAVGKLRRALEDEVSPTGDGNGLSVMQTALIQAACSWEARAKLAARWLRLQEAELSLAEKLQLTDAIAKSRDSRNRCMERLGLTGDAQDANPYAIFAPVQPSTQKEGEHIPTANNATEGHIEPQNGKQQ